MVREKCIRCEKYIVKGGCNVGRTEYLRTFLKAEKGVTRMMNLMRVCVFVLPVEHLYIIMCSAQKGSGRRGLNVPCQTHLKLF